MIEAVNFSGPTFVIFNHFQHGPDAVPLKRSRRVISGFMLLDWCFSNENVSRACVYISIVSISTVIHALACLVLNFAKMLQPRQCLGDPIMQLITIPFARSHKEISSEEMKSHPQSCKHGCVLLLAR